MTRMIRGMTAGALLLVAAGLSGPTRAERVIVRNVDLHPATPSAARRTIRRIDEAALRACGASSFSLAEVKFATRGGPCWQEAAGNAVRQSGNPLLAEAFSRFAPASR